MRLSTRIFFKIVQCFHCFPIIFVLTISSSLFALQTNAAGVTLDIYKNRDVLATRTMPDLAALKFGNVGDHKNEYFNKLLAAWDNLNFDRTFISRGNYKNYFFLKKTT